MHISSSHTFNPSDLNFTADIYTALCMASLTSWISVFCFNFLFMISLLINIFNIFDNSTFCLNVNCRNHFILLDSTTNLEYEQISKKTFKMCQNPNPPTERPNSDSEYDLNEERFHHFVEVVKGITVNREDRQVRVLLALQELMHRLDHPPS